MEYLGLIHNGCPRCKANVNIYAIVEPVVSKGRCVTITLQCETCPWDKEKHVKLSFMIAK